MQQKPKENIISYNYNEPFDILKPTITLSSYHKEPEEAVKRNFMPTYENRDNSYNREEDVKRNFNNQPPSYENKNLAFNQENNYRSVAGNIITPNNLKYYLNFFIFNYIIPKMIFYSRLPS